MSIALNHITLSYGSRTLLEDVTAAFAQGSLTALIGRNGTGKSTLLRAIAGLGTTVSGRCGALRPPAGVAHAPRAVHDRGVRHHRQGPYRQPRLRGRRGAGTRPYTNWIGACRRPTAPSSNVRSAW